jgi:serine/threonine protein phosphatase PrpC
VSFDAVSVSHAGGREVNEDYVDVLHTPEASCWVIADGLGGHRGGAIASKLVVETALRSFQEQPQVSAEQVERHVEQAQEALLAAQRSDAALAQMRSTIVVLVANDREAVWGHVGDSRLYHLRGGRVIARTRDHSVSQALVDGGQIDERQQGVHEDRSRLLRSLGKDGEPGRPTIGGPIALCRGDAFLLCTDGFWEPLDETAVEIDYAGADDAAAWLDRLDARLRAQDLPLKDNYTAACVRLVNAAAPPPPPHDPRQPASTATAATVGGGGRARPSSGSMPVAGVAPVVTRIANEAPGGSLFGAHRETVKRVLYVSMAIALIALLYTAYLAYPRESKSPNTRPPHDPAVSVKPVTPDPEIKSPPSGTKPAGDPPAGSVSGSGAAAKPDESAATAGAPPTEKPHYGGPADMPDKTVYRPAKKQGYPTLQAAIADAEGNETIWIGPGDYSEELAPIATAITLKGAGRDRTSLSLTGVAGLVLTGKSGGLEDLALTAAAGPAVLEIGGSFHGTIKHVRIHDGSGVGILMRDAATPTLIDTAIENNRGGQYSVLDNAKPKMP